MEMEREYASISTLDINEIFLNLCYFFLCFGLCQSMRSMSSISNTKYPILVVRGD